MVPGRLVRVSPSQVEKGGRRLETREWVTLVHVAASGRLPEQDRDALTTDDLAVSHAGAEPGVVNVWQRMGMDQASVDSLWGNLRGIEETAQVASPPPEVKSGHIVRGPWVGFQDVQVPVGNGVVLFGRLGVPEKGDEIPGSFVIITHGLFGTLDGLDMENHVQALRRAGHHVLALEMRGHGETNCCHPEYIISFGIYESSDLLAAARWLKAEHGAARVGLVSFSLTGYESLLAAWLDGNSRVTGLAQVPVLAGLPGWKEEPAFNAGMFIVSAPVGVVDLADRFDARANMLDAPCKATFQDHVAARLASYHEAPAYSMWALAKSEFVRGGFGKNSTDFEKARDAFMGFIDLSRDQWRVGAQRMENIRVPVLVLSAANDPLGTAQGVAELFGRVHNPNVGVILLKEGGHMGFSALSADYYYSVMLNFFDPKTAPRMAEMQTAAAAK